MTFLEKHEERIVIVAESGCWIWMGSTQGYGYGQLGSGKKSAAGHPLPTGAHRASYEAAFGAVPPGRSVLHRCDVPSCVNPHHLFLGSQQDNLRDMRRKGRQVRGGKHGMAKVSEETVRAIRAAHIPRVVTAEHLASRFGLRKRTVRAILERQTWQHI